MADLLPVAVSPSAANAKPIVQQICAEFNEVRPMRQVWDGHWQDIKELVRCDTSDFNRKTVQGYRRYDYVYDGTAIKANEELASGLHSNLSPATERWFELSIDPAQDRFLRVSQDPQCLQWFEIVADIMYNAMSDPRSNFNPAMHEGYLDLGSFGTCVLYSEWDVAAKHIVYRSFALNEFYLVENNKGRVDKVFRYFEWTARKIGQEFPDYVNCCPKLKEAIEKDKTGMKQFKIIHYVAPRTERAYELADAQNKPFCSVWICETTMECIHESGFNEQPYTASRWVKLADEVFGRGPAMTCLPDIKSLQAMQKVLLKAGQKAVDPPLVVPDEGFLLPIKTAPGSLIFKEPGAEKVEALEFKGNVEYGVKQVEQKQAYIRNCFYEDWFKRFRKNREQTAAEVEDDRDEMLRFLGPMLGRQNTELLGPMLHRTYMILHRQGMIPPAPPKLQKTKLCVIYTSPAARALQGVKADRMARVFADTTPMAQVNPDIWDAFDLDKAVQIFATARGAPRGIMRTPEAIAKIRAQKAQAAQMQQMAQTAQPAAEAMKSVAQAHQLMNGGGGQ